MNFQIYQLAYRYEIVNCNHVCMQDMTCDVMDWVCPIFRGVDNASSLVSAIIGWIYYLIYILYTIYNLYTLWWLHNALKEPYSYSRCLNLRCLYELFSFSSYFHRSKKCYRNWRSISQHFLQPQWLLLQKPAKQL